MNKRQKKKNLQKAIGKTLSLKYGTIKRKYLGTLYKMYPSYFAYFDKQHLRKVWKNITNDSIDWNYHLKNDREFECFRDLKNKLINESEYFISKYESYKKSDMKRKLPKYMYNSISWLINYNFGGEV